MARFISASPPMTNAALTSLARRVACATLGLTSGSKHWFRVAAIGAAGQGPWSDQAMKMAP
jgi:hypothetical protein